MEAENELQKLYKKACEEISKLSEVQVWEKSSYSFDSDPPCIAALLKHGVFQPGCINATQFRLAAYFKIAGSSMQETIAMLNGWLRNIDTNYIYEKKPGSVEPDYSALEGQNISVAKTVYSSSEYGFSCPGIKQIPGVEDYCTDKCEQDLVDEVHVALFDATKAEYRHKRIVVQAECIGRRDTVFIIPKVITAECTGERLQSTKCAGCMLYGTNGAPVEYEVNASSRHILTFIEPSRSNLAGKVGAMLGISRKVCPTWKWSMTEQNAEAIYVVPPIVNEFSESDRHTRLEAYFIGHGIQTNQSYALSGFSHVAEFAPVAKLVFDKTEEMVDSLTEFTRTPEMVQDSRIFEAGGLSPKAKYEEIIHSLVYNHIKIWGREAMILAMDLTFHSIRKLVFQRSLIRGWMDILIIGDSGQGKTKAVSMLMEHYGLGYRASAEASTRAGLLYGIEVKNNTQNSLIWGAIPRHSGRLVVIDELKGLIEKGHFAELTDARSSGLISVDTIVSGKATSETRLILMSNPPPRMFMGSFSYPVEAVQALIPDSEDIRRMDLVVGVASNEIADEVIHQNIEDMEAVEDVYAPDVCKHHLLWLWNLQPDDVDIPNNVESRVLELSLDMCKTYSSMIPIVEPADQREKLIRVGVAFAARLNSVTPSGKIHVGEDHVNAAYEFMNSLYKAESLKYDAFSKIHARISINSGLIDKLDNELKNSDWAAYWKQFVWHIIEESYLQPKIIVAVTGCNIAVATKFLHWCVAYKLCKIIKGGSFVKTPNGVTFFKNIMDQELAKLDKRVAGEGEEF